MLSHKRKSLKKAAIIALATAFILGGLVSAQTSKRTKGPRALGVLEIMSNGRARLVPITILVDGKWYDAGLYMATPRPMALEPDTVYEGEKVGQPQGLFTVTGAQDVRGQWIGLGVWKPKESETAPKQVTVGKPKASAYPEDDDAPPILRRPGTANAPPAPQPSSQPSSTTPGASGSAQTTAPPATKPVKPEDATASAKAPTPAEEDPNRPVLRRGKPAREQAEAENLAITQPSMPGNSAAPGAGSGTKKSGAASGPVFTQTLAAISDAGGPEPRGYTMELRPAERQQYEATMMKLASEAIRKFSVTHPIRGKQVPNVALVDIQMPAFDVNTSNEPVLVFSARAVETLAPAKAAPARARSTQPTLQGPQRPSLPAQPVGAAPQIGSTFEYYVTVVARVDVNNDVRKLFEAVTDTSHLDAIPRLQLIDCVDANGDQAGELLFRQLYDRSRAFVLYRVGMDQLWELFEGAQSSFVAGQ